MLQADVIRIIEELAPPGLAESWDKSGLQLAATRQEIKHLAVCLDPTPEIVARALNIPDDPADMILAHHPLSLSPRFPDKLDSYYEVLALLIRADLPLYSAHTSLDSSPFGPALWLADELGLTERSYLAPCQTSLPQGQLIQGGTGCVGSLPQALAPAELWRLLKDLLPEGSNLQARLAGTLPDKIKRLALCGGSGSSLTDQAIALGADLFLTGDLKYHSALDLVTFNRPQLGPAPNKNFALLDLGHFSLEEEMMRRTALELSLRLPQIRVSFLPAKDPFQNCNLAS